MMTRILFFIGLFISLTVQANAKSTTVLIYWAVDNDLYEFSIPYLKQFEPLVGHRDFNMVLEYDYPGKKPTERFHNFELVESIGEKNSANADTLIDFINFGVKTAPADQYILVIASHGANWDGIVEDVTSKKWMQLSGLARALEKTSSQLPKQKFDMIVFDACRMSYLETLFMIGDYTELIVGSAFDVNGFNHKDPLNNMIKTHHSMLDTGIDYVRAYPEFPGNREYMNMGASLLQTEAFMDVLPLSKFFNAISAQDDDQFTSFTRSLFRDGAMDEDWGMDLLEIIKRAGEIFPELQADALFLTARYAPIVVKSSVTKNTRPHGGLGLTCAEDLRRYRVFEMSQVIPEWTALCKHMRKIY
jgi:hypothetical protein